MPFLHNCLIVFDKAVSVLKMDSAENGHWLLHAYEVFPATWTQSHIWNRLIKQSLYIFTESFFYQMLKILTHWLTISKVMLLKSLIFSSRHKKNHVIEFKVIWNREKPANPQSCNLLILTNLCCCGWWMLFLIYPEGEIIMLKCVCCCRQLILHTFTHINSTVRG